MGINSPIAWGVNWPSNGGLLYQKRGSRVGCWPRVVCCRRGRHRTRSYSDSRLSWDARFLIPASKVELQVAQTGAWHGTRSYSDPRWMGREVTQTRVERGLTHACVWSLCASWDARSAFWTLRVEVRFASEDLSLVIFGHPTEPLPKFSILRGWLRWISKYFGLQLNLGFPWLDWQSFEIPWAWSCLHCGLREYTVELLEASRKDRHKCLRNSV